MIKGIFVLIIILQTTEKIFLGMVVAIDLKVILSTIKGLET